MLACPLLQRRLALPVPACAPVAVTRMQVVAQRCRDAGSPRVKALPMDVMDLDSHKRIVAQLLTEFKKIDILVRGGWLRCCVWCCMLDVALF